jgi:hypothetical protein
MHVKATKPPLEKFKERSEGDLHAPAPKRQKADHQISKQRHVESNNTLESKRTKDTKPVKEKLGSKTLGGTGSKPKLKGFELPKQLRTQVEIDEDKEIAWLEHQLGLGKSKSKNGLKKMLEEDGLDGTRFSSF